MIARLLRIASHIIILLIIVQAFTGILLSLHYVPDAGLAEVRSGVPGRMFTDSDDLIVDGDTLAGGGDHVLVPAESGEIIPSTAAASVTMFSANSASGFIIREVHHQNASALIIILLIWFVLLVVHKAWHTQRAMWVMSVVGLVVVLAAAFTGRLLPDDQYAYVSSQIVRHELSEFPFGWVLTSILGLNAPESARLSTPYAVHAIILPILFAVGLCLVWRKVGKPSLPGLIGALLLFILAAAMGGSSQLVSGLDRSAMAQTQVTPWWPFYLPSVFVSWFGAELTGYIAWAGFLALITLPLWARRTR